MQLAQVDEFAPTPLPHTYNSISDVCYLCTCTRFLHTSARHVHATKEGNVRRCRVSRGRCHIRCALTSLTDPCSPPQSDNALFGSNPAAASDPRHKEKQTEFCRSGCRRTDTSLASIRSRQLQKPHCICNIHKKMFSTFGKKYSYNRLSYATKNCCSKILPSRDQSCDSCQS
jgi:hypothetical protein